MKEGRDRFNFLGQDIRLVPSCGIFVTMNPGYAGRCALTRWVPALHFEAGVLATVLAKHCTNIELSTFPCRPGPSCPTT